MSRREILNQIEDLMEQLASEDLIDDDVSPLNENHFEAQELFCTHEFE